MSGCIQKAGDVDDIGESAQQPADETANWQIYTNKEYGFEFKYPKDWPGPILEKYDQPITAFILGDLSLNKNWTLNLGEKVISGMEGGNYYEFFLQGFGYQNKEDIIATLEADASKELFTTWIHSKGMVNGSEVMVFGSAGICGDRNAFIFDNNNQTVEFTTRCGNDDQTLARTFDQILSTFKFIK